MHRFYEVVMEESKTKRRNIILILMIVIAVIAIVLSLNRYICEPWETEITIEDPILVQSKGGGSVVLTSDSRSIIVINKNNRIENRVSLGILNSTKYYTPCMALTNDAGYFVVHNRSVDSSTVVSEQIYKYNLEGKKGEVVFACKYDQFKLLEGSVLSVFERNGDCFAVVSNPDRNAIAVLKVSDGSSKSLEYANIQFDKTINSQMSISFAWYDNAKDRIFVMDQFGNAYSWSIDGSGAAWQTSDFESDAYYTALYANSAAINTSETNDKNIKPQFEDDRYNYLQHKPEAIKAIEGKSYLNSTLVQLRIWLFWLGVLVLSILILLVIGRSIHGLRVEGKHAELKRVAALIAIGLVCMIIVVFYSYELINSTVKHTTSTQRVVVQMEQANTEDLVSQAKEELDSIGRISVGTYNAIADSFYRTTSIGSNEELGVGYSLSIISNGRIYPIIMSERTILSASLSRSMYEVDELKANECVSTSNISPMGGFSNSRIVYTDQEGNAIATLYAYNDITVTTADYLKTCADLFIKLFVGALVVVYAVMEIMAWLAGARRRRSLKSAGIDFQGVALARPLVFLNIAVNACDSALIVLIVKDMLSGTEHANNLVLCSLPMTVMGLGFLLGGMLTNRLLSNYNAKRVLFTSTIIEIIALIGEAWSVFNKNVVLLLAFMLIMTIFNEVSIYYAGGYAATAPNDDLRRDINIGNKAAELSAYAVITVFAGYACSFFGNYTIYLVALVPALISLVIICLNKFDDRIIAHKDGKSDADSRKERLRFLLAPQIIILLLCGVFASQILGGYKSYVFPLFADQGGITKASISNIQVFAKAIVFFSLPVMNKYQKRLGDKNVIIVNNLILAAVFFMFVINQSVIWAVLTLIFTYIGGKGIDLSELSIWQEYALKNNVDLRMAQSVMSNVSQVFYMSKSPILGCLLGFGQVVSCVIIGGYLTVSAFVLKLGDKFKK
uniref:Uncharacterized protein n=1 Tax=uncultured bacterium fosmid pJB77G10 TaxID=1478069 RepID=A0A0H3UAK7_9BACT|nr:hypothetical protein [uncultured bacterium fosmid pJB77G10]